jgi:heme A synthase
MPFNGVPEGRLRRVAVPAFVAYLLAFVPFILVGDPAELTRLQLAGSVAQAREIVSRWSSSQTVDLAFLQGVDFIHPLVYSVLLSLAAVWAGRRLGRGKSLMPWIPVAAASFDVLENIGMVTMIRGDVDAPVPMLTTAAATAKYVLLGFALLFAVAGLVARLRSRGV